MYGSTSEQSKQQPSSSQPKPAQEDISYTKKSSKQRGMKEPGTSKTPSPARRGSNPMTTINHLLDHFRATALEDVDLEHGPRKLAKIWADEALAKTKVEEEMEIEEGTIEIPVALSDYVPQAVTQKQECHVRPALYVKSPHSGAQSDQILSTIEQHWRVRQPDVVLLSISDSHPAAVNRSKETLTVSVLQNLQDGLHNLAASCDVWFVCSGVQTDLVSGSIGRMLGRLRDDRYYAIAHSDFMTEHEGDIECLTSITSVAAIGVNCSSLSVSSVSSSTTIAPDGLLTHFVLFDEPVTAAEVKKERAKLFCRLVYDYKAWFRDTPMTPTAGHDYLNNIHETNNYTASLYKERKDKKPQRGRLVRSKSAEEVRGGLSVPQPSDLCTSLPTAASTVAQAQRPAALALFTSSDVNDLAQLEMVAYAGLPVLVIEDASPLCTLLARVVYSEHEGQLNQAEVVDWLRLQLLEICRSQHDSTPADLASLEQHVSRVLSITRAASQCRWFVFGTLADLGRIGHYVVDTYAATVSLMSDELMQRAFLLMIRLNVPQLKSSLDITPYIDQAWCFGLLEEALKFPNRESFVEYLLGSGLDLGAFLDAERFMRLLRRAKAADFFQSVILAHILGYERFPSDAIRFLRVDLCRLLAHLSGVNGVFPAMSLLGLIIDPKEKQLAAYSALTYWALLMKRPQLALLVCSHAPDPIPLSLTSELICRRLAARCQDWDYYAMEYKQLSHKFRNFSVQLLSKAHREAPHRSYDVLCHHLRSCGSLTATQLAYASENKAFIAHECCQRWVGRMLYGQLQVTNLPFGLFHLPAWAKVIVSAFLIFPIRFWFRIRTLPKPDSDPEADRVNAMQILRLSENADDEKENHGKISLLKLQIESAYPSEPDDINSPQSASSQIRSASRAGIPHRAPSSAALARQRARSRVSVVSLHKRERTHDSESARSERSEAAAGEGAKSPNKSESILELDELEREELETGDAVTQLERIAVRGQSVVLQRQSSRLCPQFADAKIPDCPDPLLEGIRESLEEESGQMETVSIASFGREKSPDVTIEIVKGSTCLPCCDGGLMKKTMSKMCHVSKRVVGGGVRALGGGVRDTTNVVVSFIDLFIAFVCMPITKYWLALIARICHLTLYGIALSQPGCGNLYLDLFVWFWSLTAWMEACWVLHRRHKQLSLSHLKTEVYDATVTAIFLLLIFMFKVMGTHMLYYQALIEPFFGRVVFALYMLFLCYRTLFHFIPMSETLGPLLVCLRLMVVRDMVYFIILVTVLMCSSAVVIQSIVWPDYPFNMEQLQRTFNHGFFSLFLTDLSGVKEGPDCRKNRYMYNASTDVYPGAQCSYVSGYTDPECSRVSVPGYFSIVQYYLILKLICMPLLFALFARTAAEVDVEMHDIWKYQFYDLISKYRLHPVLPPPFTPIAMLLNVCCRASRRLRAAFTDVPQHPDIFKRAHSLRDYTEKDPGYYEFWQSQAIVLWDDTFASQFPSSNGSTAETTASSSTCSVRKWHSQSRLPCKIGGGLRSLWPTAKCDDGLTSDQHQFTRSMQPDRLLVVEPDLRSWTTLVSGYAPAVYDLPPDFYQFEWRSFVDYGKHWAKIRHAWRRYAFAPQTVPAIRRPWNTTECEGVATGTAIKSETGVKLEFVVLPDGMPLNPRGRTGLAGRGLLPRFGPNHFVVMIVLSSDNAHVLLSQRFWLSDTPALGLPVELVVRSEQQLGGWTTAVATDALARIMLRLQCRALRTDPVYALIAQRLNSPDASIRPGSVVDGCLAHVAAGRLMDAPTLETDNAWLEVDVWALKLVSHSSSWTSKDKFQWQWFTLEEAASSDHLMNWERELIAQSAAAFSNAAAAAPTS